MNFTVKCIVMEGKLIIHAVAKETGRVFSTEFKYEGRDFLSPHVIRVSTMCSLLLGLFSIQDHTRPAEVSDLDRVYPNLQDTVTQVRLDLCQRLVPESQKPGYQETRPDDVRAAPPQQQQPPTAQQGPPRQPPPMPRDPLMDPTFVPRRCVSGWCCGVPC
jgi:hypothetical protein